jgi:hypothetical protein
MSDPTFPLTHVRITNSNSSSSKNNTSDGLESLTRARQLHSQLNGVVATLNVKVGEVLAKQEREFLRAYRA